MIKLKDLSSNALKSILEESNGLYHLTIYTYSHDDGSYEKLTSMMSKRLKDKFDVNYNILKHCNLLEEEIEESFKNVNNLIEKYKDLKDKFKFSEIISSLQHNEIEEEISSIEHYIKFYIDENSSRYENLNVFLNDAINEISLLSCSNIELLLKVQALNEEMKCYYKTTDYLDIQLSMILKQEKNELFKSIFTFILKAYKGKDCKDEFLYDVIFSSYKDDLLKLYEKRYKSLWQFIDTVYLTKNKPQSLKNKKIYKSLEEYNDEEFDDMLEFYLYKIREDGVLGIEQFGYEEQNDFLKTFLEYLVDGVGVEDIYKLLEMNKNKFLYELDKKIDIVKLGLKSYVSYLDVVNNNSSRWIYEEQLKMLFDMEVVDELFEFNR